MIVLGICGSSGSGKSTVCSYFEELGYHHIDCDQIYHQLINHDTPCLREIGETFGNDLIENHVLDRKKLAQIVFSDKNQVACLNQITHKYVLEVVFDTIARLKSEDSLGCVIDAPLLFEAGLNEHCDYVIAVTSRPELQIHRLFSRDGIDKTAAEGRLKNQTSDVDLKEKVNFVIENTGTLSELQCKVVEIVNTISHNEMK